MEDASDISHVAGLLADSTCYDHLAGTVATALYDRLVVDGTLHVTAEGVALIPRGAPRALRLTTTGRQALASHFDVDVSVLTNAWALTPRVPSP